MSISHAHARGRVWQLAPNQLMNWWCESIMNHVAEELDLAERTRLPVLQYLRSFPLYSGSILVCCSTDSSMTTPTVGPVTDVTKWRLHCEKGRQIWEYDELGISKRDQNFIEKHALGMDTVSLVG